MSAETSSKPEPDDSIPPDSSVNLVDKDERRSARPPDPRIGTKVDNRYIIKSLLGQGGMGVVYLAVHEALDRQVAIKVLKPDVSRDEKIISRFRREARAASAIGSPHICDVSDFGTLEDGSTYFVMEMLDGPSLSSILKGKPLKTERILKIGAQLAEALGAAHARQIVHRDLKPDNVHLVKHGDDPEFVKVLDFGIAKVANTGETKLTQAGQVFGTPHYMSPEQCAGHEVDLRTDIYALGVMLYEMACGKVPFDADTLMGLLTKHVYEQPIPPRKLPAAVDLPAGLEAVILKCLAKKPSSRYQTMGELKADLEALQKGHTPDAVMQELDKSLPPAPQSPFANSMVPGEPPHSSRAESDPSEQEKKGSGMKIALIVIPALAAAAFGITYFLMPPETTQPTDPPPEVEVTQTDPTEVDPPEDPPEDPAEVEDPTPDPEPDPPPAVSTAVQLTTAPEGAEVFGPDGSLVGNTPVTIVKPAAGEAPVEYRIHLSGFTDRSFTVGAMTQPEVLLTMDNRPRGRSGRRSRSSGTGSTSGSAQGTSGSGTSGSGTSGSGSSGSGTSGSGSSDGPSLDELHTVPGL
ncbi:MAG TPA: serine/threonine protein kinase [Polyangiaceae bacterium]|nr:serine/threonine protein kinase [Polyangiaceae bacterium]